MNQAVACCVICGAPFPCSQDCPTQFFHLQLDGDEAACGPPLCSRYSLDVFLQMLFMPMPPLPRSACPVCVDYVKTAGLMAVVTLREALGG